MATGGSIYLLLGAWALVILVTFILAIRLSYRIEARSPLLVNGTGVPRWAMLFHTPTNLNVARDAETQAMRRRMNLLLLLVLAGFAIMFFAIRWVQAPGA